MFGCSIVLACSIIPNSPKFNTVGFTWIYYIYKQPKLGVPKSAPQFWHDIHFQGRIQNGGSAMPYFGALPSLALLIQNGKIERKQNQWAMKGMFLYVFIFHYVSYGTWSMISKSHCVSERESPTWLGVVRGPFQLCRCPRRFGEGWDGYQLRH